MTAQTDINVGVIGLGWGARVHGPAFQAAEGYALKGLCARDAGTLEKAAANLAVEITETDWRAFIARGDLDLISVAVPPPMHSEITIAAVQAGKHVFVEKPVAPTAEEAWRMLQAAEAAGVQHATGFEFRWQADRYAMLQRMSQAYVGAPYMLRLTQSWAWNHPSMTPPQSPGAAAQAKLSRAMGGGFLNGMLSHDIDFARALFGDPVSVMADTHVTRPRVTFSDGSTATSEVDDITTLLLRFADGKVALLNASVVGIHQSNCRIEIYGADGTITGDSQDGVEFCVKAGRVKDTALSEVPLFERQPKRGSIPRVGRAWTKVEAQALMLEDWRPAFDGAPTPRPIPSLRDGWAVQRIIEAAFRSSAGEGWVKL